MDGSRGSERGSTCAVKDGSMKDSGGRVETRKMSDPVPEAWS